MHTYLERLAFCLREGFPPEVTSVLLRLVDADVDIAEAQAAWAEAEGDTLPDEWEDRFREAVEIITGSEAICCERCADWVWRDDASSIHNGDVICDYCVERHYTQCYECEEYHRDYDVRQVENNSYCESCFDDNCNWCDDCETYYRHESHDHEEGCDCEAPRQRFLFPANGDGNIGNDERLDVTLPAGTIDEAGMQAIRYLLVHSVNAEGAPLMSIHAANGALEAVGDTWHGDKGNFTRRLSRELHSNHKVKIPPAVLTEVGNLAKQHSSTKSEWSVEFTRNLNLSAEDFYHEDSCWWQSYYESRCALKNWGGIGMRMFDDDNEVTGRAWVQPLNVDLAPTHDALGAHAYIIYNCYGSLDGAKAARIVAHLTGRTYGKTVYDADSQYVNGNAGWLVADEATCAAKPKVYVGLDPHTQTDAHTYDKEVAA